MMSEHFTIRPSSQPGMVNLSLDWIVDQATLDRIAELLDTGQPAEGRRKRRTARPRTATG